MGDRTKRNRYLSLLVGVVAVVLVSVVASGWLGDLKTDDGLTDASNLTSGDCFEYPGDGVELERLKTVACTDTHYGEVVGTTSAGNYDACVGQFETYASVENYWESGYILGFIEFEEARMHCYAYLPTDSSGSILG